MLRNAAIAPFVPVADLARARRFYEETLGLVPRQEFGSGVIYDCGDTSLFFMVPSEGAGSSRASCAFWHVGNLEAEMAELRARGVVFEEYDRPGCKTVGGIATQGRTRTAWFRDSEGNLLALSQVVPS